jgi:conjugative transfer signal peptidase TraF
MQFSVDDSPQPKSCARPPFRTIWLAKARSALLVAVAGLVIVAAAKSFLMGHLLVNFTPSIPQGLYWVTPGARPGRGELVTFPIPQHVRTLLYERQYVPRSVELLSKPVAAVGGDRVCIRDRRLIINGRLTGEVLQNDQQGRPMPHAAICETLSSEQVFVATRHANSFDSRNFGPVSVHSLRGTLTPLLTVRL